MAFQNLYDETTADPKEILKIKNSLIQTIPENRKRRNTSQLNI
jgi:hypothetical protein